MTSDHELCSASHYQRRIGIYRFGQVLFISHMHTQGDYGIAFLSLPTVTHCTDLRCENLGYIRWPMPMASLEYIHYGWAENWEKTIATPTKTHSRNDRADRVMMVKAKMNLTTTTTAGDNKSFIDIPYHTDTCVIWKTNKQTSICTTKHSLQTCM